MLGVTLVVAAHDTTEQHITKHHKTQYSTWWEAGRGSRVMDIIVKWKYSESDGCDEGRQVL
ncbi:hypothetical protein E2C01_030872 [Portunus trituberculatus]|uniref:Uncharacterized protein n=1 Tax=Portunus trituberculatus TaxID=210409 RepID=A0A5B7EW25_PORTR|nr:hypothetical protein [Portunus trituberculatus]